MKVEAERRAVHGEAERAFTEPFPGSRGGGVVVPAARYSGLIGEI